MSDTKYHRSGNSIFLFPVIPEFKCVVCKYLQIYIYLKQLYKTGKIIMSMGKKEQRNITSLTTRFDALMLFKSTKFFYKLLIRLLC